MDIRTNNCVISKENLVKIMRNHFYFCNVHNSNIDHAFIFETNTDIFINKTKKHFFKNDKNSFTFLFLIFVRDETRSA